MHRTNRRVAYVLRSDIDTARHYVGVTSDVAKRLAWHTAGRNIHTARNRPWSVVSIEFASREAAGRFERRLKSGRALAKRHFC